MKKRCSTPSVEHSGDLITRIGLEKPAQDSLRRGWRWKVSSTHQGEAQALAPPTGRRLRPHFRPALPGVAVVPWRRLSKSQARRKRLSGLRFIGLSCASCFLFYREPAKMVGVLAQSCHPSNPPPSAAFHRPQPAGRCAGACEAEASVGRWFRVDPALQPHLAGPLPGLAPGREPRSSQAVPALVPEGRPESGVTLSSPPAGARSHQDREEGCPGHH